jgi:hypothetical protein
LIYRKLDENGDMVFGFNSADFYSGVDAVGQAVYTGLRLLQGEWWEDTSAGFPLLQSVIGQPGSVNHQNAVDMLVQEQILSTQGVQSINNYSSVYVHRQYVFNADIQTIYGAVGLEEVTFG